MFPIVRWYRLKGYLSRPEQATVKPALSAGTAGARIGASRDSLVATDGHCGAGLRPFRCEVEIVSMGNRARFVIRSCAESPDPCGDGCTHSWCSEPRRCSRPDVARAGELRRKPLRRPRARAPRSRSGSRLLRGFTTKSAVQFAAFLRHSQDPRKGWAMTLFRMRQVPALKPRGRSARVAEILLAVRHFRPQRPPSGAGASALEQPPQCQDLDDGAEINVMCVAIPFACSRLLGKRPR